MKPTRAARLSGLALLTVALAGCEPEPSGTVPRPTAAAERATPTGDAATPETGAADNPYVGLWVTSDGHVRHEILPDGRYVEARGDREAAYTGRYTVSGDRIEYLDDTGFTADGHFVDDDTLIHAGMTFTRQVPSEG